MNITHWKAMLKPLIGVAVAWFTTLASLHAQPPKTNEQLPARQSARLALLKRQLPESLPAPAVLPGKTIALTDLVFTKLWRGPFAGRLSPNIPGMREDNPSGEIAKDGNVFLVASVSVIAQSSMYPLSASVTDGAGHTAQSIVALKPLEFLNGTKGTKLTNETQPGTEYQISYPDADDSFCVVKATRTSIRFTFNDNQEHRFEFAMAFMVPVDFVPAMLRMGDAVFDFSDKATAERVAPQPRELRDWTNTAGRKLKARYVRTDTTGNVILALERRPNAPIALSTLSAADQDYVRKIAMEGSHAGEERDFELVSGDAMTFCWVPPGEYFMGSPQREPGHLENENPVPVTITRGFWLAKSKCTLKHAQIADETGPGTPVLRIEPVDPLGMAPNGILNRAWATSWQKWKQWLALHKPPAEGWRFDFPTEAQWEYACRAGTIGMTPRYLVADLPERNGSHVMPSRWGVGDERLGMGGASARPNPWGLQDMLSDTPSGLHMDTRQEIMMEFCRDGYSEKLPGGENPLVTEGDSKAVRGGTQRSSFRRGRSLESACGLRAAIVPDGL